VPVARAALQRAPQDAQAALELAKALEESGDVGEAETVCRRMLQSQPENAELNERLGVFLKRQRRHEEALAALERAKAALPSEPRGWVMERANVLRHLGRGDEAIAAYRAILSDNPRDLEVHRILAEFSGDLSSYDRALDISPAAEVAVAKGRLLMRLGQAADAEAAFRRALAIDPDHAPGFSGLGAALESHDTSGARAAHRKALELAPANADALEAFAAFLLRQGEHGAAQALAERAHSIAPASQTALALLGLAWRAQGDGRDAWLNDYGAHVQIFDLAPPSGFADMASFNRALATYLEGLHAGAREYFTQTLRGGTQLHDEMFYNGHALVDLLQPRIDAAVAHYIRDFKASPDHPLMRRRGRGFRYAGSWSSCLKSEGFHTNHMHHQGWISSCYYVAVPDAVKDAASRQGWITFGAPSGEFGAGYTPLRAVEPRPGRLVLFPSFMWHGTNPFHAPSPRITIAFDAVPA
jgi:Flp pilus assembly protein TadD